MCETKKVQKLYRTLSEKPCQTFPKKGQKLNATVAQSVYVISKGNIVLHVGRTLRGKGGLNQRLQDHLYGASSFSTKYLKGNGAILRKKRYVYKFIKERSPRLRALLEAYAIGVLCPRHIGTGI